MPIDTTKLICPAIFQNFLEDKSGFPLSAGVITFYEDSNRTVLKNVYQQTGVAGDYTYIAAPNPMTLSAAGTTVDVNGNDILLFFYPWNEANSDLPDPYFVTVYNANDQLQFTRSNFPFNTTGGVQPSTDVVSHENYIVNHRFWRNINTLNASTLPGTWTTQFNSTGTVNYARLCPDQNDGFSMPDFNYIKPNSAQGLATETISFLKFPVSPPLTLSNDIQPEYYLNHQCTIDSPSGSYTKIYQFPITFHTATLASQPFVFTIQVLNVTTAVNLKASIYSFAGSGAASPVASSFFTISTSSQDWEKKSISSKFPSNASLPANTTGDDAFYLQLSFSSGACDFSFAIPSIYIYENPAEIIDGQDLFSFSTYDQIDSVISLPRVGDIRTSVNDFYYGGWLPMNNGTIGNASSNCTALILNTTASVNPIETWPLYDLLWQKFHALTVNGSPLIPIYTSAASPTTYGSSSYSDWSANKAISLTQSMGQVMMGTAPLAALLTATPSVTGFKSVVTASNSGGLLWTTSASNLLNLFKGNTVTFSSTASLVNVMANQVYYVYPASTTTFYIATTFANAMAGTPLVSYTGGEGGTVTASIQTTASYEGEYAHTQLSGELATHAHGPTFLIAGAGFTYNSTGGAQFAEQANTNNAGSSTPFNVTQPGVFSNIYIKL